MTHAEFKQKYGILWKNKEHLSKTQQRQNAQNRTEMNSKQAKHDQKTRLDYTVSDTMINGQYLEVKRCKVRHLRGNRKTQREPS